MSVHVRGSFENLSHSAYIIGHEKTRAYQREYYISYMDSSSASKVYDNFVSECVSLRPRGSVPAEFGSWLSKIFSGGSNLYVHS